MSDNHANGLANAKPASRLEKLQAAQAIATMASLVIVPIVVALVGWQLNKTISTDSVRKDYVQMAIGILSQPATDENKDLRKWAAKILEVNSPVPMPVAVKGSLSGNVMFAKHQKVFTPLLDSPLMEPPERAVPMGDDRTVGNLISNYNKNMVKLDINTIRLEYLQELIRSYAKMEDKNPDLYEANSSTKAESPEKGTPSEAIKQ